MCVYHEKSYCYGDLNQFPEGPRIGVKQGHQIIFGRYNVSIDLLDLIVDLICVCVPDYIIFRRSIVSIDLLDLIIDLMCICVPVDCKYDLLAFAPDALLFHRLL